MLKILLRLHKEKLKLYHLNSLLILREFKKKIYLVLQINLFKLFITKRGQLFRKGKYQIIIKIIPIRKKLLFKQKITVIIILCLVFFKLE